eukprot:1161046-Pelagomonas_calceolata.AAC.9
MDLANPKYDAPQEGRGRQGRQQAEAEKGREGSRLRLRKAGKAAGWGWERQGRQQAGAGKGREGRLRLGKAGKAG